MMSDRWDVHCLDCDEDSGMEVDRGRDIVRLLVENRASIEPLGDLHTDDVIWDMDLRINDCRVSVPFFRLHRGHRLVPRNEAGETDVPCGMSFLCPSCGPVMCERLGHVDGPGPRHWHTGRRGDGSIVVHWEEGERS
jgi:hypothetical protein